MRFILPILLLASTAFAQNVTNFVAGQPLIAGQVLSTVPSGGGGSFSASRVQFIHVPDGGGLSTNMTVSTGSVLLFFVHNDNDQAATAITSTSGGDFTKLLESYVASSDYQQAWACTNPAAGSQTISITAGGILANIGWTVIEYSGVHSFAISTNTFSGYNGDASAITNSVTTSTAALFVGNVFLKHGRTATQTLDGNSGTQIQSDFTGVTPSLTTEWGIGSGISSGSHQHIANFSDFLWDVNVQTIAIY